MSDKLNALNKDIKKLKVINIALIAIAIGLNLYAFIFVDTLLITNKISYVTTIAALVFGAMYALKNYKKEANKSFNLFINICIVTLLLQLTGEIYSCVKAYQGLRATIMSSFTILIEIAILVILECVKNIGKEPAIALGCTILGFSIFGLISNFAAGTDANVFKIYLILSFSAVALACVICLFIVAKYSDPEEQSIKAEIDEY